MKGLKRLIPACCLLTGFILSSCDDVLTTVGTTIQPKDDLITVYTDTFRMEASTVKLDSIFAKTTNCLLGEMYDPIYGNIKADFLCQFYCEDGFQFEYVPHEGKIDSMELVISYYNGAWHGDSLTPMRATVYPIIKPLVKNFYSNDNPEDYCDMSNPLGAVTYTAFDMSVSDSLRNLSDDDPNKYYPYLSIKLPVELGQKFYDETINNPSSFSSQDAFNSFFPGIYVTTTFGSGNIIESLGEAVRMRVFYSHVIKGSEGQDSLVSYWNQWFSATKGIVQINRFKNSNIDRLLEENATHTYIKAPAGVCTRLVLPTKEMSERFDIDDRYINGFSLDLKYLPEDERDFAYNPPSHLLLLPEDSVKIFFEGGRIEDSETSFLSYDGTVSSQITSPSSLTTPHGYSPSSRTYTFGNISSLLKAHMKNAPDKDLSLLVLPVTRVASPQSSGSGYYLYYTTDILNSFTPSGVKIRTEDDYMKVVVLSSKFEDKK